MNYRYLIDSSAWLEYYIASDKGLSIKNIIEKEAIATSIIAIAELADKFERDERDFHEFLLFIRSKATIINITIDIALYAAKIKKTKRIRDSKFGLIDAIHLATALKENATFITADYDFKNESNVMILG